MNEPVIRAHNVTLYGDGVTLRPMRDEHLPDLYRWNADPEVLYWTESGTDREDLAYDEETVRDIYGGVSQNALCFIIEVEQRPVGECWLQKMNIPEVSARYPEGADVRRIDLMIGEKAFWGRGIGTKTVGLLTQWAFEGERADVLHCFSDDYNVRSRRVWEKNGYTLAYEQPLPQPQKGKVEYHWRLTRADYLSRRRASAPLPNEAFFEAMDKLVSDSRVVIDRPKNSRHPRYPNFVYPVDYGYLENTSSMDGAGIDVWRGTHDWGVRAIIVTVDLLKRDSEIKLLLGCDENETRLALEAMNNPYMKGMLIRRGVS